MALKYSVDLDKESEVLDKIYTIKSIGDMLNNKMIKKSIFVPNKIINIVI